MAAPSAVPCAVWLVGWSGGCVRRCVAPCSCLRYALLVRCFTCVRAGLVLLCAQEYEATAVRLLQHPQALAHRIRRHIASNLCVASALRVCVCVCVCVCVWADAAVV